MTPSPHWVFLTDAGPDIGLGHVSRTTVMSAAVAAQGVRGEVYAPRPVPLDGDAPAVTVAQFTEHDLGHRLAALDSEALVLLDLPDERLATLQWLARVPVFRAAFRMFGPTQEAVEHVSLTPAYHPDETVEHHGAASRLPLVELSGWGVIVVRASLFGPLSGARPASRAAVDPTRPSVLVTMGGSDPHDLTGLACEALAGLAGSVEVVVAVGRSNHRFDRLSLEYGTSMSILRPTTAEFDELLRAATVAVISGGLTRYECMAAGTPFVAIAIHDRQAAITREVTSRGFGLDVGPYQRLAKGAVAAAVERLLTDAPLRHAMVAGASDHVRPDTPARIVARLTQLRSTLPWQAR